MASKRIRGITIEIGGDTTDLGKALSGVDKQLTATQTALQDTQKLLKFDPGNTELLAQQQRQLADSIDLTKDRLQALQDQQQHMDDALKAGNISQQQYDAYRREVIETEAELKNLEKQQASLADTIENKMKAAGKHMQEFGDRVKNVGDKMTSVGTGMTKYVTGPILAAAAAAGAAWKELDDAQDDVIRATGATGDAAERLGDIMVQVAETVPETYADIGSTLGAVATRFGDTGEDVQALTTDFLKFSKVTGSDVEKAVIETDKLMKRWGIDAKDTDKVLGLLAKSAQKSGQSVETVTNNIAANSEQLQDLGLNLGEAVDLMTRLDTAGLDTNTMLAGLKKAQQNAAKEGKPLADALHDVSERILNAKDDTDALAEAQSLFGNKGASEFVKAIQDGALSLEGLNGNLSDYAGLVSDTYEATLDPIDKLTTATNGLKAVGKDLFEDIMAAAAPVIEDITDAVKDLRDGWNDLDGDTQQHIVKFGLIAAAIGPVVTILGKAVTGVGNLISALGGLATGGPIMLILGGLGLLASGVAGFVDELKNGPQEVQNLTTAARDLASSADNYAREMQTTLDDYAAKSSEVDIYIGRLEELDQELRDNGGAGYDAAAKLAEYQTIVGLLNETLPGLNAQLDEETGLLLDGTDAIRKRADAWVESQKRAAFEAEYASLIQASAKAEAERSVNTVKLEKATDRANAAKQRQAELEQDLVKYTDEYNKSLDGSAEAQDAAREKVSAVYDELDKVAWELDEATKQENTYREAVDRSTAIIDEHAEEVDAAREAYARLQEEQAKTEEAEEKVGEAAKEAGAKFRQSARDTDEYKLALEETRGDIEKTIGLFQNMDFEIDIEELQKQIIEALNSQLRFMSDYAANLKTAAERGVDEGLLAVLSDGTQQSAQYLAAITQMTDEELQEMNELWRQSAETQTGEFAQALTDGKTGILNSVDVIIDDMLNEFDAQAPDARERMQQLGSYLTNGLSAGIADPISRRYLTSAVQRVLSVVTSTTEDEAEIASPSKVMERLGRYISEGFALGITDEIGTIEKAASDAANAGLIAGEQADYTGRRTAGGSVSTTTTNNSQTVNSTPTINIYAQPGQSAEDIAEAVSEALAQQYADYAAAWA